MNKDLKKVIKDMLQSKDAMEEALVQVKKFEGIAELHKNSFTKAQEQLKSMVPAEEQKRELPIIVGSTVISFDGNGAIEIWKGKPGD